MSNGFRLRACAMPLVALLALAGLTLAGCSYPKDRLQDFADMVRVNVGVQWPGIGVEAKATGLFHPSLGTASTNIKLGWDTRTCFAVWPEAESYFPMSLVRTPVHEAASLNPLSAAIPAFYSRRSENPVMDCGSISRLFFSPPPGRSLDDVNKLWYVVATVTDVEAGASALVVNARAGVNVAEAVDFILGFFFLDPAGDDTRSRKAREEKN